MPKVSSFSFTNITKSENTIAPYSIGAVSNYGELPSDDTSDLLSNKTCALDQPEIVSYSHKYLKKVDSKCSVQNPPKVTDAIQYQIRIDDILRTTNEDGSVVDNPIVAYLTIRHELSGNIAGTDIDTVVERLLGACRTSTGTWRFADMMRGMLKPVTD